jgi:peptide chain release factor 1
MTGSINQTLLRKLEAIRQKYHSMGEAMGDPKVLADSQRYQQMAKERAELAEIVGVYQQYLKVNEEIRSSEEIVRDTRSDPELRQLASGELKTLGEKSLELEDRLMRMLIPKDPRDEKNIFLEVRAGTGGNEAALFAGELVRMYTRYAERRGWHVETVSSSPTGIGGLKEAILLIEGKGTYNRLKYESGVHRVQRVPVTEAGGRIHTSTVTVAVLPEAEEIDVTIDPKDLRIDTFCASGPGGQGVNTTYSAVRITHLPTKMVVSCQDERSQLKNKAKAMRILRSRLMDLEKTKQETEIAKTRKAQVGTGERSEKIRTYNFSQNRVTDHRVGLTLHRLDQILEGDLDEFIETLISSDQTEKLKMMALTP